MIGKIARELRAHAPFTAFGAFTGIIIILIIFFGGILAQVVKISPTIFFILHPAHVFLSALVTASMYKLSEPHCKILLVVIIGYVGSIGIATISDSIIPYVGELLLNLPNRGIHRKTIIDKSCGNFRCFISINKA